MLMTTELKRIDEHSEKFNKVLENIKKKNNRTEEYSIVSLLHTNEFCSKSILTSPICSTKLA